MEIIHIWWSQNGEFSLFDSCVMKLVLLVERSDFRSNFWILRFVICSKKNCFKIIDSDLGLNFVPIQKSRLIGPIGIPIVTNYFNFCSIIKIRKNWFYLNLTKIQPNTFFDTPTPQSLTKLWFIFVWFINLN